MRHSAFVCLAARINDDLLKWISLGALWSWLEHLDSHMHLFLNKYIIQWTPATQMMHRDSVSSEAISIVGTRKQGEGPKDIWVCPVLNVTQCARTVWHRYLTGVPSHLGFPTVQLSHVTAHVLYIVLLISILSVLSSAFSSPKLLRDLACAPLAIVLTNSCRDWEGPLWTAVGDCPSVTAISLWPSCFSLPWYLIHTH